MVSDGSDHGIMYGDMENSMIAAGQGVGLIDSILTCEELIEIFVKEAEECLGRLRV